MLMDKLVSPAAHSAVVSRMNRYALIVLCVAVLEIASYLLLYGLFPRARFPLFTVSFLVSHFLLMLWWMRGEAGRAGILRVAAAGLGGYVFQLAFAFLVSLLAGGVAGVSEVPPGLLLAAPFMALGIVCAALVGMGRQLYQRILIGLLLSPFVAWICMSLSFWEFLRGLL